MKRTLFVVMLSVALMLVPSFAVVEGTNKTIKLDTRIYDELKTYDEVDYFNFKLSKSGSIKIDFEFDVNGRYFVKLIDTSSNEVLQNLTFESEVNTASGTYSKSSNKIRLNSGKYQISVSSSSWGFSDEEYELKVNYEAESGSNYEKERNDTAKDSMLIDYNRKITGNLESSYDTDFYMVDIEYPGTIQLKLQYDRDSQYNVDLYSEVDGRLNQLQNTRFTSELVVNADYSIEVSDKVRVPEGIYYIKITNGSWSSYTDEDYILTILYNRDSYGNYEEESNDAENTATFIYASEEVIGNLSSSRDVDYYYIRLWGNKYYLNMNIPQNAQYNVAIYKEDNGKLTQLSYNTIKENGEYIEIENCDGYYYIKVTSRTYVNDDYIITVINENQARIPKTIELEVGNEYMYVDGSKMAIDGNRGTKPILQDGRVLLPVSAIVETLGGKVSWDAVARVATFELKDKIINMPLGSTIAYVNGQVKYLDVPTTTINDRTMVPVRFVAENLGCNVVWNNGKVTINY